MTVFPTPHPDVLEQTINYDVAVDMFDELAEFNGSVIVEHTAIAMAAHCDKEAASFLALNLAHDLLTGERIIDEARTFYADTMQAVMGGGKPENPEHIQGFTFEAPQEDLANSGEIITESISYVLPRLLLIATLFDPATAGRSTGSNGRAENVIPRGVAPEAEKIAMVDPEAVPLRALFDDIRERHRPPKVATYFRSLGHWPELLETRASAVASWGDRGSPWFKDRQRDGVLITDNLREFSPVAGLACENWLNH